jgi:hypothetical protein
MSHIILTHRVQKTLTGDKVVTPGIGAQFPGIGWIDGRLPRGRIEGVLLPDMNGYAIQRTRPGKMPMQASPYAIISHSLVYWSPKDRALCLARLNQKSRWYKVAKWLPGDMDVCSICASRTKVYLNIYDDFGPRSAIRLDPVTGIITVVTGAVEVRAHEDSDSIAVLQQGGFVRFRDPDNLPTGYEMKPGKISHWDADAMSGLVCCQYGKYLILFENGNRKNVTLEDKPYIGLSVCPDRGIIWLSDTYSVTYPLFSEWYDQVKVYSYSGAYLGQRATLRGLPYSPMNLFDPKIKAIAINLGKKTQGFSTSE